MIVAYDYAHDPSLLKEMANRSKRITTSLDNAYYLNTKRRKNNATRNRNKSAHYKTTSHWETSYNHFNGVVENSRKSKQVPPEWSLPKQPHSSNRGNYDTEQEDRFGCFGDNPRERLPATATKIEKRRDENFIGTTKVTMHIPGYTGFIPYSDAWHRSTTQGYGKNPRGTFLKNNATAN